MTKNPTRAKTVSSYTSKADGVYRHIPIQFWATIKMRLENMAGFMCAVVSHKMMSSQSLPRESKTTNQGRKGEGWRECQLREGCF